MENIPQEKTIDNSIRLLREGYPYLMRRSEKFNSEIFKTRLLGQKVVCIHGEEAAKVFYDTELFKRDGAVPKPIQESLFGTHTVHTMDDEPHRHRKAMFMSFMGPESINKLLNLAEENWQEYISQWEQTDHLVVLFEEAQEIFCRSVCEWVGVPLKEEEVRQRTDDFMGRIDSFGSAGLRYLRGRLARRRTEKWIGGIIDEIRSGKLEVSKDSPVYHIAMHRDLNGNLPHSHTAAVSVNNLLRPTVAIAYYVTFAALALHEYPEYRQKLRKGDDKDIEMFVQEVRRFYPFVPFLGARVRKEFEWKGYSFEKDRLVLLDVYGTLHDPKHWDRPNEFRPERFLNWNGSPFDFIPQGGGDPFTGHRCAGEWVTIGLAKVAVEALIELDYEVPKQNFGFSLSRMPSYPESGFTVRNIRRAAEVHLGGLVKKEASGTDRMPVADRNACPYHKESKPAAE